MKQCSSKFVARFPRNGLNFCSHFDSNSVCSCGRQLSYSNGRVKREEIRVYLPA
jgi:hypothetical protein